MLTYTLASDPSTLAYEDSKDGAHLCNLNCSEGAFTLQKELQTIVLGHYRLEFHGITS